MRSRAHRPQRIHTTHCPAARAQAALDALHDYYAQTEETATLHSGQVTALQAQISALEARAQDAERELGVQTQGAKRCE